MKSKLIAIPALLFGLLLSSITSAAPIEINDGFFEDFDPLRINDYQVNLEVGGSEIFTFGFAFINPNHGFLLDIDVPLGFIGDLEYCISVDPDCTEVTQSRYDSNVLRAGESDSLLLYAFSNASPTNPNVMFLSFRALDMPPLTTVTNSPSSIVPIPAAVWLFGSGLLGLVGMARRKKVI